MRPHLEAWRAGHQQLRDDATFLEQVMPLALEKYVKLHRSYDRREGSMRGIVHFKTVLLLLGECACDITTCLALWSEGELVYAHSLAAILALSAVAQAVCAYFFTREGLRAAVVALAGLKVLVETRRALWEIAPGARARS